MDGTEFAAEIRKTSRPDERVAWFGALLRRETRRNVEVVGGSAIEVYLSSASYVSEDIDLVGDKSAIEGVLRRWRFSSLEGRSQSVYWSHTELGLVDLVGGADRSGIPPRKVPTPYGVALLSAPEPLIIRRLMRAQREGSEGLYRQAVALARLGKIDWEYLTSEARYEKVEELLRRLRRAVHG